MTPQQARDAWRRGLAERGERLMLRRLTVTGIATPPHHDAEALGRVQGYEAKELVGDIQQGDREVLVLAEDLIAAHWPVPPRQNDQVLWGGKTMQVVSPDDATIRVGSTVVAYRLRVRGG